MKKLLLQHLKIENYIPTKALSFSEGTSSIAPFAQQCAAQIDGDKDFIPGLKVSLKAPFHRLVPAFLLPGAAYLTHRKEKVPDLCQCFFIGYNIPLYLSLKRLTLYA